MKKNQLLKLARIKRKITQTELADKLGVKQSYIAKIEKGDDFSYKQALKIAEALNVPVESFYVEKNITNIPEYINSNFDIRYKEIMQEEIKKSLASLKEQQRQLTEQIESLKKQLFVKDETLERLLASKDETIALLKKMLDK